MDINVDKYETSIDCDDNSCSLRYKLDSDTLGVMRYNYYLNVGVRIKQDIVVLREADIDRLLGDIMISGGYSPELGDKVVIKLKEISYMKVNSYVKETLVPTRRQAASD